MWMVLTLALLSPAQAEEPCKSCWNDSCRELEGLGVPACKKPKTRAKQPPRSTCEGGKVQNADTDGHCCWPGQAWSTTKGRCIGEPECPRGFSLEGSECVDGAPEATGGDTKKCSGGDCPPDEAEPQAECEDPKVPATDGVHCCLQREDWSKADRKCIRRKIPTLLQRLTWLSSSTIPILREKVTVAQFSACVDAGICNPPSPSTDTAWDKWLVDRPIEVDFATARTFCEWTGARLPTMYELGWTSRNGGRTHYPSGNEAPIVASLLRAGAPHIAPCHPDARNKDGVCDLFSGLMEWVADYTLGEAHFGLATSSAESGLTSSEDAADPELYYSFRCARSGRESVSSSKNTARGMILYNGSFIQSRPVTTEEYNSCVKKGLCAPLRKSVDDDRTEAAVSWYQAKSYCSQTGGRLPWDKELFSLAYPESDAEIEARDKLLPRNEDILNQKEDARCSLLSNSTAICGLFSEGLEYTLDSGVFMFGTEGTIDVGTAELAFRCAWSQSDKPYRTEAIAIGEGFRVFE